MVPVGGLYRLVLEAGVPFLGHVAALVIGAVEVCVALLQQNGCPLHAKVGEGDRVLALVDAGDGRIAGLGERGFSAWPEVVLADGIAIFVKATLHGGIEILRSNGGTVGAKPGLAGDLLLGVVCALHLPVAVGREDGTVIGICVPLGRHVPALVIGAVEAGIAFCEDHGRAVHVQVMEGDDILALVDPAQSGVSGLAECGRSVRAKVGLIDGVSTFVIVPCNRCVQVLRCDGASVRIEPGFQRNLLGLAVFACDLMIPVGGADRRIFCVGVPLLRHVPAFVIGPVDGCIALASRDWRAVCAQEVLLFQQLSVIDTGEGGIAGLAEDGGSVRTKVGLIDGVAALVIVPCNGCIQVLRGDGTSVRIEPGFLRNLLCGIVGPLDPVIAVRGADGLVLGARVPFCGHVPIFVVIPVKPGVSLVHEDGLA